MRPTVAWVAFVATMLGSSLSFAAPSFKDLQEARKLAREGDALLKKGEHVEAAKTFKKADKLVPAPSYKLQLAKALAGADDLVQAGQVLAECVEAKPVQWVEKQAHKKCQDFAKEVDERTPEIEVTVYKPSASEVTVKINGNDFDPAEGAVPYNTGKYEVVVTAEGYKKWTETVNLTEGDVTTLEVTMLPTAAESSGDQEEADDGGGLSPIPAYVAWGVGAVGLGLGIGFGVAAITSTNDVLALYGCENGVCPPEAQADLDTAKVNGNVSTAGFIIGAVGVTAGTILFLLSGDDDEEGDDADEAALQIEAKPLIGPGFVGVHGAF